MQNIPDELLTRQLEREALQKNHELDPQLQRQKLQKEQGRLKHQQKTLKQKLGKDYSRSKGGKVLEELMLDGLITTVEDALNPSTTISRSKDFIEAVEMTKDLPLFNTQSATYEPTGETISVFDPRVAAVVALRLLINSCRMPVHTPASEKNRSSKYGARPTKTQLGIEIGELIESECLVAYARAHFPDGAFHSGLITKMVQDAYTDRAGLSQRVYNTRHKFFKRGEGKKGLLAEVFQWRPWSANHRKHVGLALLNFIEDTEFEVKVGSAERIKLFEAKGHYLTKDKKTDFMALTDAGKIFADGVDLKAMSKAYIQLPMLHEPLPHTDESPGGYHHVFESLRRPTVKATWKADTQLSESHRAFQNKQQSVGFRICKENYELIRQIEALPYAARSVGSYKGPVTVDEVVTIQFPERLRKIKDKMTAEGNAKAKFPNPEDQKVWDEYREMRRPQFVEFFKLEKEYGSSMAYETLQAAKTCLNDERLYIVAEGDFRGRFYCGSGPLNYQGRDYQKGLLEFADAKKVDDRTEYWMKIGMTGFMGLDKLSYERRIQEFDAVSDEVIKAVRDPINNDWWKPDVVGREGDHVEKPWQWMQVAREWVRLYEDGDAQVPGKDHTRCRVPVDATCSGQQVSALWLRCQITAAQVNLIDAEEPADIYSNVLRTANRALEQCSYKVKASRKSKQKNSEGKYKMVKEPILIRRLKALGDTDPKHWAASRKGSKGILMVAQYGAGIKRRKLALMEKTKLFWLKKEEEQRFDFKEAAALYKFFAIGLEENCPAVDILLEWVKGVTQAALEREGVETLLIPLADGSVITQRYPAWKSERIETTHIGTKRRRPRERVSQENADIDKHLTSTTANFIHGGDSSALVFGLGGPEINFPFSTNHDSVSARPGKDMDVLQKKLREGLHELAENNPMEQFVLLNGLSLSDHPIPEAGSYNIKDVLTARYAYC